LTDWTGAERPAPAEKHHYPCERCGADLRFAPGESGLVCDYCGHRQSIGPAERDRLDAMAEIPLHPALEGGLGADLVEESRVAACPTCGARFEFDPAVHATECPFCASPVVADTGTQRQIKPQAVVPFRLTEEEARAALGRWLGRLWFAPGALRDYARKGRRMQGIYAPFWTFDADTRSRYTGQRGDAYYETRAVTVTRNGRSEVQNRQVRHIRWRPASGQVSRHFDDVVVLGATSLPQRFVDSLQPWDLRALEPYSPDYLAGFRAEAYTVTLAEGHAVARTSMARVIEQDVRRAIGGDEQRIGRIDTAYDAETFKHILLPIWLAAYRFRGRSYRLLVNGQSGEVRGERPWSIWKIAFAVLVVALIVGALALTDQAESLLEGLGTVDF
jgi:DNA-directed RNA polymerase subunit RPC12/RpoP